MHGCLLDGPIDEAEDTIGSVLRGSAKLLGGEEAGPNRPVGGPDDNAGFGTNLGSVDDRAGWSSHTHAEPPDNRSGLEGLLGRVDLDPRK